MGIGLELVLGSGVGLMAGARIGIMVRILFCSSIVQYFSQFYVFLIAQMQNGYSIRKCLYTRLAVVRVRVG